MSYARVVLTAMGLCFAGMAALSLAIDRHHKQVCGGDAPPRKRYLLRAAGTMLLVSAIVPCALLWGPGAGVVTWLGMLSVGALLASGLLPYWPARIVPLAVVATAFGLAGIVGLALN